MSMYAMRAIHAASSAFAFCGDVHDEAGARRRSL